MTRRKPAAPRLDPHWKVRVVLPGALLHLASRSEPIVKLGPTGEVSLSRDPIEGPGYGDAVGFIDWSTVVAVTWRFTP